MKNADLTLQGRLRRIEATEDRARAAGKTITLHACLRARVPALLDHGQDPLSDSALKWFADSDGMGSGLEPERVAVSDGMGSAQTATPPTLTPTSSPTDYSDRYNPAEAPEHESERAEEPKTKSIKPKKQVPPTRPKSTRANSKKSKWHTGDPIPVGSKKRVADALRALGVEAAYIDQETRHLRTLPNWPAVEARIRQWIGFQKAHDNHDGDVQERVYDLVASSGGTPIPPDEEWDALIHEPSLHPDPTRPRF